MFLFYKTLHKLVLRSTIMSVIRNYIQLNSNRHFNILNNSEIIPFENILKPFELSYIEFYTSDVTMANVTHTITYHVTGDDE